MPNPHDPSQSPDPRLRVLDRIVLAIQAQTKALQDQTDVLKTLAAGSGGGGNPEVLNALSRIEATLATIAQNERTIMATQQEILTEISDESTIADSILVLVQRLVSENDPAARQAIMDALKANRTKLEAAVLAGTPQQPTP